MKEFLYKSVDGRPIENFIPGAYSNETPSVLEMITKMKLFHHKHYIHPHKWRGQEK
jgi:hypothetical protein